MVARQAFTTVRMLPGWLVPGEKVEVNKLAIIKQLARDAKPSNARIHLQHTATVETVMVTAVCYAPHALLPALLSACCSTVTAWGSLLQRAKMLSLFMVCASLWAWLLVQIRADEDNMDGIECDILSLPMPTHSPHLIQLPFDHLITTLPDVVPQAALAPIAAAMVEMTATLPSHMDQLCAAIGCLPMPNPSPARLQPTLTRPSAAPSCLCKRSPLSSSGGGGMSSSTIRTLPAQHI